MEKSNDFYNSQDILFKPMNILKRNSKRVEGMPKAQPINEGITNGLEHGSGVLCVDYDDKKIVIFNKLTPDQLKGITFPAVISKLTTFNNMSDTNFGEGISTYIVLPTKLEVGDILIKNKKSPDGLYQYIETASHYLKLNEKNEQIAVKQYDVPYLEGWRVTFETDDKELREALVDFLSNLVFLYEGEDSVKYTISLNGKKLKLGKIKKSTSDMEDTYESGRIYYDLSVCEELDDDEIKFYWRLNTKDTFKKMPIEELNGLGVKGSVILTDIHQFANENRRELRSEVFNRLKSIALGLVDSNKKEKAADNEIRANYMMYKLAFVDWVEKVFQHPKYKIMKLFNAEENKRDKVIKITNFVETIQNIVESSRGYKDVVSYRKKFIDHEDQSPKVLDVDDFDQIMKQMELSYKTLRETFGFIVAGLLIVNGEPDGIVMMNDIAKFVDDNELIMFDPSEVKIEDLGDYDNDEPIIYPTQSDYLDYFLHDINVQKIESVSDLQKITEITSIEDVPLLKKYSVNSEEYPNAPVKASGSGGVMVGTGGFGTPVLPNGKESYGFSFRGAKYIVGEIDYNRGQYSGKIPFLFSSKEEYNKVKNGGQITVNFTWRRYCAFRESVHLISKNYPMFPKKPLIPVVYNNPDDEESAFYVKNLGLLAINAAYFPKINEPTPITVYIIRMVTYLLTHEFIQNHGRKFMQRERDVFKFAIIEKDEELQSSIISLVRKELQNKKEDDIEE